MKFLDGVLIAGVLVMTGALAFFVYAQDSSPPAVRISSADHEWFYPLEENREIAVTGPIGRTIISIKNGNVSVLASACPEKICVKSGSIRAKGGWIACLPNQVLITIEGTPAGAYDAESY